MTYRFSPLDGPKAYEWVTKTEPVSNEVYALLAGEGVPIYYVSDDPDAATLNRPEQTAPGPVVGYALLCLGGWAALRTYGAAKAAKS